MTYPRIQVIRLSIIAFVAFILGTTDAFSVSERNLATRRSSQIGGRRSSLTNISPLMCICINCARVTNCAAYHFVETKHEQPHMTEEPTFEPREGSPTIHVNIRSIRNRDDQLQEVQRMWREHKAETERAEMAASESDASNGESSGLHGSEVYDLRPMTTYEYDVVKCEDFIEDKGCWVRNMPQEIRDANPNFVPS